MCYNCIAALFGTILSSWCLYIRTVGNNLLLFFDRDGISRHWRWCIIWWRRRWNSLWTWKVCNFYFSVCEEVNTC